MTFRPEDCAQVIAFWRYGNWPWMYGSPGPTSNAQYPIGTLTWLSLRKDQHRSSDTKKVLTPPQRWLENRIEWSKSSNGFSACWEQSPVGNIAQKSTRPRSWYHQYYRKWMGLSMATRTIIMCRFRSYGASNSPRAPANHLGWHLELSQSHKEIPRQKQKAPRTGQVRRPRWNVPAPWREGGGK